MARSCLSCESIVNVNFDFQDTNLYFQDTNWIFKYLDCENCLTEMYFSSIKRFGFPESPKLPQLCPSDGEAQKNLILWDDVECWQCIPCWRNNPFLPTTLKFFLFLAAEKIPLCRLNWRLIFHWKIPIRTHHLIFFYRHPFHVNVVRCLKGLSWCEES